MSFYGSDAEVDLLDCARLQRCFGSAGGACSINDWNGDGTVGWLDAQTQFDHMTGPRRP